MKKIVSLLFALLLSTAGLWAQWDYAYTWKDGDQKRTIYLSVNDDDPTTATMIGSSKFIGTFNIPGQIRAYRLVGNDSVFANLTINRIGRKCFSGSNVQIVNFPSTIKVVEDSAFANCSRLVTANVTSSVMLGEYAFAGNHKLRTVKLPTMLSTIGDHCFENCDTLLSFSLPNALQSLGAYALAGCKEVKACSLPHTLTYMGDYAFLNCTGFTAIQANNNANQGADHSVIGRYAFKGCVNIKSATFTDNITSIGDYAFEGLPKLKTLVFPKTRFTIGRYAFANCPVIPNITIPSNIAEIKDYAFLNCVGMEVVTLPSSGDVSGSGFRMGLHVFDGCTALYSIKLPNENLTLPDRCFYGMPALKTIIFPDRDLDIPAYAFDSCLVLKNILFPKANFTIGKYAFANCVKIENVDFPRTLTFIAEYAFKNCTGMTVVTSTDMVSSQPNGSGLTIGKQAFYGCNALKSIKFTKAPLTLTSNSLSGLPALQTLTFQTVDVDIKSHAVENCPALKNLVWGKGNTVIGEQAFANIGVQNIDFPRTITSIGKRAFANCANLKIITTTDTLSAQDPGAGLTIGVNAFEGCNQLWSVKFPVAPLTIQKRAFYSCEALKTLVFSNHPTAIGDSAFADCPELKYLLLPPTITTIGKYAFAHCTGLSRVYPDPDEVVPAGANTVIGDFAFYRCTSLPNVAFSQALSSIGNHAFENCTALKNLIFPTSLTKVGDYAFAHCDNLKALDIPRNITTIGNYAFAYCAKLSRVLSTDTLSQLRPVTIGRGAFAGNPSLKYVVPSNIDVRLAAIDGTFLFPESVTKFADFMFADCENLQSVVVPSFVTSMGKGAIAGCYNITAMAVDTINESSTFYTPEGSNAVVTKSTPHELAAGCVVTRIPEEISVIGPYAFYRALPGSLAEIPAQIIAIKDSAYVGCNITRIQSHAQVAPQLTACPFFSSERIPVNIPYGTLESYKNRWGEVRFSYHVPMLLTVNVANAEQGTASGSGEHYPGDSVLVQANPAPHYSFTKWNDGSTQNPRVYVTPDHDVTLTAQFAPERYRIAVSTSDITRGTISLSGEMAEAGPSTATSQEGIFVYNSTVVARAASKPGFRFSSWTDGSTDSVYMFPASKNLEIAAIFNKVNSTRYQVTVKSENEYMGTVQNPGTYMLDSGSMVALIAIPALGYKFLTWNDGDTNAERSVVVTGNVTYTAFFTPVSDNTETIQYTLEVISDDESMGTVTGGGVFEMGSVVEITATPKPGYRFLIWDDGVRTAKRTVVVKWDMTRVAAFIDENAAIQQVQMPNLKVFAQGKTIVAQGCEGQSLRIFDVSGRLLNCQTARSEYTFTVQQRGVYFVRVGTLSAQKVVVAQ